MSVQIALEEVAVPLQPPATQEPHASEPEGSKLQKKASSVDSLSDPNRPRIQVTPWNFVTMEWLTPLMLKGIKKPLEALDLPLLQRKDLSSHLSGYLDAFWQRYYQTYDSSKDQLKPPPKASSTSAKEGSRPPSLFWPLFKRFGALFFLACLCQGMSIACILAIPKFIQQVILYLTPGYPKSLLWLENGYALAFCILALQLGQTLFGRTAEQLIRTMEQNVRTIIIGSIYEKSLRLSLESQQTFTQGRILNLVNVDSEKVAMALSGVNNVWSTPVQIAVALVQLAELLGVAVWAGAGTLFAVLFLQGCVLVAFVAYQKAFLKAGDERLKILREMFYGMKIIKLRGLEDFFNKLVTDARLKQLKALKGYFIIQVFFVAFLQLCPVAMPIVAFITYSAMNGDLSPQIIFPALALFNILFQPLLVSPTAISQLVVAIVSWNRIREYLLAEEMDMHYRNKNAPSQESSSNPGEKNAISIQDGTFEWFEKKADDSKEDKKKEKKKSSHADKKTVSPRSSDESTAFSLKNLNFIAPKGELIAIIGAVGCGKSSLLSSIIEEMPRKEGSLLVNGSVAYCAQQPWILTETIRGNIIFGNKADEKKLNDIIDACALGNDLTQFDNGEDTQIGEKGVNLSGGQKARVALARALYQDADIYLLDDPLSALDSHVGQYVLDHALKDYLKGKTVLLVTHQLHVLPYVDRVVVMDHGAIVENGKYSDLIKSGGLLSTLIKEVHEEKPDEKTAVKKSAYKGKTEATKERKNNIIAEEDRVVGAVQWATYKSYFRAAGGASYLIPVVFAALVNQLSRLATDLWLSWWTDNRYGLPTQTNLNVYAGLGGSQLVFALLLNTSIIYGAYRASKYFHGAVLARLLSAPMSFYDSQPIGRLLNRMSKDVESIDQQLWLFLFLVIISCTGLLGIVVLLTYVIYPMIALFVPLVVLYFFILKYYQRTFRELKRLDSVERSPLYAHLSESLQGLSTIRAFKVTDRFVEKQRKLMDLSNIPAYLKLTAAIWVNIRIELIGTTVTLLLILLGVSSTISPSSIGLGLTYAIALCGNINLLLIASSQLDSEMNAVERLDTYVNLPQQEAARELPNDPDEHWPTKGSISIQNLELRYSTGDQRPVIRDLTMEIKPGEKVGIVGRTGSGKSTLLLALFRIIEPVKGTIHIDGLDICGMGLKRLRTGMQIIAQEPVLFTGTIRSNLDVESEFQDSDIWDVLEMIGMKEFVTSQSLQLEALVTENGENLSVGQRQLLTLGRAILKKPRILILDEATASVDTRADNLIQQSIKTHFAESTVISIAHRLNTIIDFDRVLVLDNGQKVEYDSPMALLQNKNSSFFKLAEATGQSNLARLQEASKKV